MPRSALVIVTTMRLKLHQELGVRLHICAAWLVSNRSLVHLRKVTEQAFSSDLNTTAITILLANGSLFWAVTAFLDPELFMSPAFEVMRVIGSGNVWASLFFGHFAMTYWRTYDPISRPSVTLAVNSFGFLLWFFSTVSLMLHDGGLRPTTALEVSMCCASAWALYKTRCDS